jgi:hypothetical protein
MKCPNCGEEIRPEEGSPFTGVCSEACGRLYLAGGKAFMSKSKRNQIWENIAEKWEQAMEELAKNEPPSTK